MWESSITILNSAFVNVFLQRKYNRDEKKIFLIPLITQFFDEPEAAL